MHATPRRFIIKADDYARGPLLDPWRRFIDLCLDLDAAPSIGIVGADYASNIGAQRLARFAAESYGVEFWNHSLRHCDMTALSPAERVSDTQVCHRLLQDTIGVAPIAYGAPFNKIDAASAQDIVAAGGYRVLYESVDGASGALEIPRRCHVSPEVATQSFRPIRFHLFRKRFDAVAATGLPPLLVLQIHPPYWAESCFAEFRETLAYLLRQGLTPITAADYADFVDTSAGRPPARATPGAAEAAFEAIAGDTMVSGAIGRVPPPTHLSRALTRLALFDARVEPGPIDLVEVGDGVGLWAAAASTIGPRVRASAVVATPEAAEGMPKVLRSCGVPFVCAFNVGAPTALPLADDAFDFVICNDGATAPSGLQTLAEAARVLKVSGRLLLSLDNEAKLVDAALRGAQGGDLEATLRAVDLIFAIAGRRAGVLPAPQGAVWWNDSELAALAMFAGLQPMARGLSAPAKVGEILGVPLRWQNLFIRTDASRRRGDNMRAGAASAAEFETLIGAGEGARLLGWIEHWVAAPAPGLSTLGLAVQAHAAGGEVLAAWEKRAAPMAAAGRDLAEIASLLAEGDYAAALKRAASASWPLPAQGMASLSWLSLRANGDEAAVEASDPLLEAMRAVGAAALAGDRAAAAQAADHFLADPDSAQHLLVALAGPVPDTALGFTATAYESRAP